MGRMSPGVGLLRAVRLPPTRKVATSIGAQSEVSRWTTARRVCRSGVCKGPSAASIRCYIQKPEGPAAVSLGKDLRMSIRLTSGGNVKFVLHIDGRGMAGQALLGCLLMSSFQVSSLLVQHQMR